MGPKGESREPESEKEEKKLRLLSEQGFFDRNRLLRFVIAFFFAFCVFIFLHFREVRVDTLELGNVAKHYVIAQVDFEFPDEEATIVLRQKAIRNLEKIYRLQKSDIEYVRETFESTIPFQKRRQDISLQEVNQSLDLLEDRLMQALFTDKETALQIQQVHFPSNDTYVFLPGDSGTSQIIPNAVWDQIRERTFIQSSVKPQVIDLIIAFYRDQKWSFLEDKKAEAQLKRLVQSLIPEKYTKVKVGEYIIHPGDKVTSRHIAMMQAMKESLSSHRNLWGLLSVGGSLLMTLIFLGVGWQYFRINHPDILASNRLLALLVTILVLNLALAKLTEAFLILNGNNLIKDISYPIFVPFSAVLITILMSARLAIFCSGFLAVVMSMTLAVDRVNFLVINLIATVVVVVSAKHLHKRNDLFWIMGRAWLACVVVILAFYLYDQAYWGLTLAMQLISSFLFLLVTAIVVAGLLPLFESTFHILTDLILMEYMDPSNELLERLAIEAPGTYQHSVVVGHLSESAARSIGANALFCRVSSLYHDIGKLNHPQYFTENQQRGVDMHQLLIPKESASVIIAHVSDGVSMARKANLPEPFIDIIKEHHGTTLVYFFYHKEMEKQGGDKSKVQPEDFRYSGPKPRSKESAIIMIADTLEAASRSLEEVEKGSIVTLVDEIIRQKAAEGQFEECLLTFQELGVVRDSFVRTLLAASHSRIKYPKREIEAPA